MKPKRCKECGAELKPGPTSCPLCGAEVKKGTVDPSATEAVEDYHSNVRDLREQLRKLRHDDAEAV